jgi:thiamine biosynthesis lipoprotein
MMNIKPTTVPQGSTTALNRLEHIMGMPIRIDVQDRYVDPAVLDTAFNWLRWVDATFSTYKQDSEISRLNRGELTLAEAHPHVRFVLERCEQLCQETDSYFDIWTAHLPVPVIKQSGDVIAVGIDPSGFVKGWAVDQAAKILDAAGARNYAINAGGDIRVRGHPDCAPHWRVGIRHPLVHHCVAAVVPATEMAIATSGSYERGEHIIDPHTGRPPSGVLSVTIIGPELATADAYATAAFAMGEEGPRWTLQLVGYEAMTILANELVLYTPGFPVVTDTVEEPELGLVVENEAPL